MKINPSNDLAKGGKAESPTPAGGRPGAAGAKGATLAAGSATIHLSEMSTQLTTLASSLAASGEFDQAKVDEIKQAITDGKLSVNAEVVADRMLTSLRDMLAKPSKA
jgi:negative regulator of flagellin synthesis FlgM